MSAALDRVLASLDAVRNLRALWVLLAGFALTGLLLAMAESALTQGNPARGAICAGLALAAAFFAVNTAGLMLMDQALGQPVRQPAQALRQALLGGHRVLLSLLVCITLAAVAVGVVLVLLWAARLPWVGATVLTLVVPVAVVVLGLTSFCAVILVGPLTGPAIWAGASVRQALAFLRAQLGARLPRAALLMAGVYLLTALVTAAVSFIVASGGRALTALAILGAGIDLPAQQLMAGLFGWGLRSLGASGAPVVSSPLGMAALTGGGVVFAVALVLPTLVYLRGCCAVYLVLAEAPAAPGEWLP